MKPIIISNKISNLNLDIFSKSDSFSVIHWQCEADLKIRDNMLVVENDSFDDKTQRFIKLAKSQNISLALTPEYSFSWKILDKIIADTSLRPSPSKLWCFGMQCISVNDFDQWCGKYGTISIEDFDEDISSDCRSYVVIFDGFKEKKEFVNVLAYLFIDKQDRLVILFQSKLEHMRDTLYDFEARGLSLGKSIYLFNQDTSTDVFFCSLICADAFEKRYYDEISACTEYNHVILFHPQCNNKPYQDTLMLRLNDNLDYNWNFIRLNWAQNSTIQSIPLNTLGTDYIYKAHDNIKDTWAKSSFRECYVKNRSKGLNMLMDSAWKCQWTFSGQEHIAQYSIKKIHPNPTIIHASNQIVVNHIYLYENDWISQSLCPLKRFQELISINCSEPIDSLMIQLTCSNCRPGDQCPLLLWDRFFSLCRGNADHEVFSQNSNDVDLINNSITNLSKSNMGSLVQKELKSINKIGNYLKDIVRHSQDSENINIKTLQYLIPYGAQLFVDENFPQNKRTICNLKGKSSGIGVAQEGHVVYTKETLVEDLNLQLKEQSKKTDAKELGVLLFYPDGDDSVRLFPNPKWVQILDISPYGTLHKDTTNVGLKGGINND